MSFNDAFDRLLMAFNRYHTIPRRPENISKIGSARRQLEAARREVADARRQMGWVAKSVVGPSTAEEALRIWAAEQRGF